MWASPVVRASRFQPCTHLYIPTPLGSQISDFSSLQANPPFQRCDCQHSDVIVYYWSAGLESTEGQLTLQGGSRDVFCLRELTELAGGAWSVRGTKSARPSVRPSHYLSSLPEFAT